MLPSAQGCYSVEGARSHAEVRPPVHYQSRVNERSVPGRITRILPGARVRTLATTQCRAGESPVITPLRLARTSGAALVILIFEVQLRNGLGCVGLRLPFAGFCNVFGSALPDPAASQFTRSCGYSLPIDVVIRALI